MEAAMAEGEHSEALLARYGRAQEAFARDGGYDYELRIEQVLTGLGFRDEQQQMLLAHCSGGQKTRALLARLLLEKPDLLVLDEPTNHLDIDAVAWLEETLNQWDGALLVVSHDRYFLDQVVTVIWEMRQRGMETYRGNYSAYVTQREERWAWRAKEFETVHDRFMKDLDFIKRNIVRASSTDRAKGLLKRLIRQVKAVEAGGTQALNQSWSEFMRDGPGIAKTKWNVADVESHIKSLPAPDPSADQFRLRLRVDQRGGDRVLWAKDAVIGHPATPLFHIDDLLLQRGECAALIGANGTGKSTFLRTLQGELEPLSGQLRLGANLDIRYFEQAYEVLDPHQTVLDELLDHQLMGLGEARNLLARYLFRGDDVYKPMRALSGGERGRFALAVMALHPVNFLLLDEPTNHLDIPSQEALEDALRNFPGTVLLVTHDRYLIDRLATQVWALEDAQLRVFRGNYTDYVAARREERAADKTEAERQVQMRNLSARQPVVKRASEVDPEELLATIDEQEAHLDELAQAMVAATESQDWAEVQVLDSEYKTQEARLSHLVDQWERAAQQAEAQGT
jgi:ATP-binding cassette subfamily F protein 3